jgi:oligopeptide/dipeptide ABC transporter ATP-binding protein
MEHNAGEELLKLDKLSIEYKIREGYLSAVKNISLSIGRGEIFAIVGESGCGKSTIAHGIMRLFPDKDVRVRGGAYFEGENLNACSDKQMTAVRGKRIGMIFQNPLDSLNPVYRSGSQVAEAIYLDKKNRGEVWKEVIDLYRRMKMPDPDKRVRSFPHELSGGMRQRVIIAMMLARNPKLLFADEPTTALDVTVEAQILEIMSGLRANYNASILLITHNFGLVAEVADRVAVMYAGELAEQGSVFEIFQSPSHPYTELLMKALPRRSKRDGRLQTIDGTVPRITDVKPGCRFYNRCSFASGHCESQDPPLKHLSDTHSYACHNR